MTVLGDEPFSAWDTDVEVENWRQYDLLGVELVDSSASAHRYQLLLQPHVLSFSGKAQIAVEQNAEIEITATDDSDVLNFNIGAGSVTGFPSAGDSINILGYRVGVLDEATNEGVTEERVQELINATNLSALQGEGHE